MSEGVAGRSGLCWEDSYPWMHRACSGTFTRMNGITGDNRPGVRCTCRCHVIGIEAMTWLPGRHGRANSSRSRGK